MKVKTKKLPLVSSALSLQAEKNPDSTEILLTNNLVNLPSRNESGIEPASRESAEARSLSTKRVPQIKNSTFSPKRKLKRSVFKKRNGGTYATSPNFN